MIASVLSILLVGAWSQEWQSPRPYVGIHWSTSYTRGEKPNRDRQTLFRAGAGIPFAEYKSENTGLITFILAPEVLLRSEMIGGATLVGFEQEFYMGPASNPLYLYYGVQSGLSMFVISRNGSQTGYGVNANLYFGPRWYFGKKAFAGIQFISNSIIGNIPNESIESSFAKDISWTLGVAGQFGF